MSPALENVARLFPAWVGWSPLLYPLFVALVSLLLSRAAAAWTLRPLRKLEGAHWTERARLAFPARLSSFLVMLLLTLQASLLSFLFVGPLTRVPAILITLFAGLAAFIPSYWVRWSVESRLRGFPCTFLQGLRGSAILALVFLTPWVVVILSLLLGPVRFSDRSAVQVPLTLAALIWAFLGGGTLLTRRIGLLDPPRPRLREIVEQASVATGVRFRAVYEMQMPMANAAAVFWPRILLFTVLAVERLSDDELQAIAAHELAHLTEPLSVRLKRMLALPFFLLFALAPPIILQAGLPLFGALLLASYALVLLVYRAARRMEQRADVAAGSGAMDAAAHGRALSRLHELNGIPAATRARHAVHPDLYDRLLEVGVSPDYPRPAPPPRTVAWLPGSAVAAALVLTLGLRLLPDLAPPGNERSPAALLSLGWSSGAEGLARFAGQAWKRHDLNRAALLYGAAADAERRSPIYPAGAAICLARAGRLAEAKVALREVRRRRRWRRRHGLLSREDREAADDALRAVWEAMKERDTREPRSGVLEVR